MGLNSKEIDWLEKLEKNIDANWDDLSPWEKKFMEDILERFRRYGEKTVISPRQWAIITEISDKAVL